MLRSSIRSFRFASCGSKISSQRAFGRRLFSEDKKPFAPRANGAQKMTIVGSMGADANVHEFENGNKIVNFS